MELFLQNCVYACDHIKLLTIRILYTITWCLQSFIICASLATTAGVYEGVQKNKVLVIP